jgi:hypothetical protein
VNPVEKNQADAWIVRVQGKEYGPVDLDELRDWKREGRLIRENEVREPDSERWILAEDEPDLLPYDQDLWANRFHSTEEPLDALLPVFDALRAANLRLWADTSPADRARVGQHLERGPESYELTFRLLAGHDRVHIAQARAGLDRIRARRS